MEKKTSLINCHAHIFTGDHVPPYLAKTFLPWPLYYILSLSIIVGGFRLYFDTLGKWRYKPRYKRVESLLYYVKIQASRTIAGKIVAFLLGMLLAVNVFYIISEWIGLIGFSPSILGEELLAIRSTLDSFHLVQNFQSFYVQIILVLIFLVLFKSGRNFIFFILKKIYAFLGILPGRQTKELLERYLNIGRYAFHRQQSSTYMDLRDQYPKNTGFVILPMDMEYMEAGKLKKGSGYLDQMAELVELKQNKEFSDFVFPFVFADPRRLEDQDDYFRYKITNNHVELLDCHIKDYIMDHHFSGFKIYPALGYYPFDERLLPLWKYAVDNNLPIMTHCIKGTIFYRGTKKKEWDRHPIFQQNVGSELYEPLLLKQTKNIDFINNFTHPLNYLCLLDETLLRKVVKDAKDPKIRELFGYSDEETELTYNLSKLKICFAHYGGDDEWKRFLEMERYDFSKQIITNPDRGIKFFPKKNEKPTPGKMEQLWKYVDWYSLISSMMLQYENVYADISYIVHSDEIHPLLKHSLKNVKLKDKILFGTDFYVVRNHKTEKYMLAECYHNLGDVELDTIAYINPKLFLFNNIHGDIKI